MSQYRIEQWVEPDADGSDGLYTLAPQDCTEILGSASEWLAVVAAIKARESRVYFKRLAIGRWPDGGGYDFWCPRNAHGGSDHSMMNDDDADEFSDHVVEHLRDCGEPCVRQGFDPIELGA